MQDQNRQNTKYNRSYLSPNIQEDRLFRLIFITVSADNEEYFNSRGIVADDWESTVLLLKCSCETLRTGQQKFPR